MTIRTTLLEARPLAGDEPLADDFMARFHAEVAKADPRPFIAAKLEERDVRHAEGGRLALSGRAQRQGGQGRPARPQHPVLDRPVAGAGQPAGRAGAGRPADRRASGATFEEAFDFLWRVARPICTSTAGRAEEKLTFDLQPEVARRMGWRGRGDEPAVERFMRRYFLIARDVGALTRAISRQAGGAPAEGDAQPVAADPPDAEAQRWTSRASSRRAGGCRSTGPEVFAADPVKLLIRCSAPPTSTTWTCTPTPSRR